MPMATHALPALPRQFNWTRTDAEEALAQIARDADVIVSDPDHGVFLLVLIPPATLEFLEAFGSTDEDVEDDDPAEDDDPDGGNVEDAGEADADAEPEADDEPSLCLRARTHEPDRRAYSGRAASRFRDRSGTGLGND